MNTKKIEVSSRNLRHHGMVEIQLFCEVSDEWWILGLPTLRRVGEYPLETFEPLPPLTIEGVMIEVDAEVAKFPEFPLGSAFELDVAHCHDVEFMAEVVARLNARVRFFNESK